MIGGRPGAYLCVDNEACHTASPCSEWKDYSLAYKLYYSPGAASLDARVQAFQRAHGIDADGLAGPVTYMQVNRASGVDEPHLQPL